MCMAVVVVVVAAAAAAGNDDDDATEADKNPATAVALPRIKGEPNSPQKG